MARTISYRTLTVGAVIAGLWACLAAPGDAQQCPGDCDQNGQTGASELALGVQISIGAAPLSSCPILDQGGDGAVSS